MGVNFFKIDNPVGNMILTKGQKMAATVVVLFFLALTVVVFFSNQQLGLALGVGLLLILFLAAMTVLALLKAGVEDAHIFRLFFIVFFIHLASALFLYYLVYHTSVRPFGGGSDFDLYQNNAIEVAHRFRIGNFSLEGLFTHHYFAVIIGIIYLFTLPHPIVGQLLTVWLAAVSALLAYRLVMEIGGSKKWAFAIALITMLYPSYLFFGSVLLKEILVIPLVLIGLILSIRMFKRFSLLTFLALFVVVSCVIHFRFYIGLALMFSFMVSWFFVSNLKLYDRIVYGLAMVFLLGLAPSLMGYGYMGQIPFDMYVTKKQIKNLRDVVYAPVSEQSIQQNETTPKRQPKPLPPIVEEEMVKSSGTNSSFTAASGVDSPVTFVKNYILSFVYTLIGPLPWQIKVRRQMVSLIEMIPWWFFVSVIAYNIYRCIKDNGLRVFLRTYQYTLCLVLFAILATGAVSLFINNFGILVRIRMPMFIALLCLMSLGPYFFDRVRGLMPIFKK